MPTLYLDHITKTFPGVKALDNVALHVQPGEIHSICGENGAGKSTLMNVLAGNLQPDSGQILIDGKVIRVESPQAAFNLGIAIVYQHLSLADSLSVAENIFVNRQPRNRFGIIQSDVLYEDAKKLLLQLGLNEIDPATRLEQLSPPEKQMVEIAKALSLKPSIFILDEPTASLTEKESKILFAILQQLKANGTSILYISHRLNEIFQLSDRITILKDGKSQGTYEATAIDRGQLIMRMVGREIKNRKASSSASADIAVEVNGLTGRRFRNISFTLMKGEILGLAGLIGAGRTEIARAIIGADKFDGGQILLNNKPFHPAHPAEAIAAGMAYIPEERKRLGLFPEMSVQDNIISGKLTNAMRGNFYSPVKASQLANSARARHRIASPGIEQRVINLSGGNQQKVVIARWLLTNPDVLIVDEPTHGIDVGAKYEIYEILQDLARHGKSILMISSDLPELIGLCDRILVIRRGEVAGELNREEVTEEKIMALAAH